MSVVKLDLELKKRIISFISKDENRFEYPTLKNFVDKAVLKMLKEIELKTFDKGGKK